MVIFEQMQNQYVQDIYHILALQAVSTTCHNLYARVFA